MKPTSSNLIRWAGLSAMAAGIIFVVVQMIHPSSILSSVTTDAWANVHFLSIAMCLFGLYGITGLYARQSDKAGWLGLVGYLLLSLWFAITAPFLFVEAFIEPLVATTAPKFVESLLALVNGSAGEVNLGLFATLYSLTALLYMLGGVLFGVATFRARILPRWAGILLAVGAPSAIAFSLLGFERLAAIPVGIALAWLGYAAWSGRQEKATEPLPGKATLQLGSTVAE